MKHELSAAQPHAGRRQRERNARRQDILGAARAVFAECGYPHATLEEIATRADLAKGTIYNYFRSKEEIFQQVIASVLEDLSAMAEDAVAGGGSAREAFFRFASQTIEYFQSNGDVLGIIVREMMQFQVEDAQHGLRQFHRSFEQLAAILARTLKRDHRGKHPCASSGVELAQIFVAMVHHRCVKRLFQEKRHRELDPHEEALLVTTLFFDGVQHL
jgi:AcrR family transcriptional regulator